MRRSSRFFCASIYSLLSLGPADQARANVFGDVWGVFTDPLKINAGSENIYQTMLEADKIVDKANKDTESRLNQLRDIYREAESNTIIDVTKLEDKTIIDVTKLEDKINNDLNGTILNAECSAHDVLNTDVSDATARMLNNVSDADLTLTIGSWTIAQLKSKRVRITNTVQNYEDAISFMETNQLAKVGDATNPREVSETYSEMERLALTTRCSFRGQPSELKTLNSDAAKFELLAQEWRYLQYKN